MEITIRCDHLGKVKEHTVRSVPMTIENIKKLYSKMSQFPVIFGKALDGPQDFLDIFMNYSYPHNDPIFNGLFWSVDDFETGVFYLTHMSNVDATVHFAFFDKRVAGKKPLFDVMLKHAFDYFKFQRLNAAIPKYVKPRVHEFVKTCGFFEEGLRRKAASYKGKWYDEVLYGITKEDIPAGSEDKLKSA